LIRGSGSENPVNSMLGGDRCRAGMWLKEAISNAVLVNAPRWSLEQRLLLANGRGSRYSQQAALGRSAHVGSGLHRNHQAHNLLSCSE
jgi:hypothetical protein